jgi:hypothetical protein
VIEPEHILEPELEEAEPQQEEADDREDVEMLA